MADKKTSIASSLVAGATAKVLEQGAKNWLKPEHLAMLRYMAQDAIRQCPTVRAAMIKSAATDEAKAQIAKLTDADLVGQALKAAFTADDECAYASEFKKLLQRAGDIPADKGAGGYE